MGLELEYIPRNAYRNITSRIFPIEYNKSIFETDILNHTCVGKLPVNIIQNFSNVSVCGIHLQYWHFIKNSSHVQP